MAPPSYAGGRGIKAMELVAPSDALYDPVVNLGRDGNGRLTSVAKVLDGVTQTKTITRDGNGFMTSVSQWVETP